MKKETKQDLFAGEPQASDLCQQVSSKRSHRAEVASPQAIPRTHGFRKMCS